MKSDHMRQSFKKPESLTKYIFAVIFILCCIQPLQAADLPDNVLSDSYHINVATANSGGFYIKFDGGGLNALHITTSTSEPYGQVTTTSSQSGTFYISDTGGRGFCNDMVLMVSIKKPAGDASLPDNMKIKIKSSGFQWDPTGVLNKPPQLADVTYVEGAVDGTYGINSILYGPQKWKPAGQNSPKNYPIYNGQDMSNEDDLFYFFFVDLKVGNLGENSHLGSSLKDSGMIKVEYSIENLNSTMVSFNGYGWTDENQSNQGKGISWTNDLTGVSPSGYTVIIGSGGSGEGAGSSAGAINYESSGSDYNPNAPKVGNLNITSSPSGAKIYLDGNHFYEVTNASFTDLPAGDYAISLELEDYEKTKTKWVTVRSGYVTDEHFSLILSKGSCYVESLPKGADIFLDGKDTLWHTNSEIKGIDVGNHTITVSKPGYKPVSKNITIKSDELIQLSVILTEDGEECENIDCVVNNEYDAVYESPCDMWGEINLSGKGPDAFSTSSGGINASVRNVSENTAFYGGGNPIENFLHSLYLLIFAGTDTGIAAPDFPIEKTGVPARDIKDESPVENTLQPLSDNSSVGLMSNLTPQEGTGTLYVNSYPENLPVYFDGKESGYSTPHFFYGIKEGRHKVGVRTSGAQAGTFEEEVWVFNNENAVVNLITNRNSQEVKVNVISRDFRNLKFKVKDRYPEYDFPALVSATSTGTYITVYDDGKFYSFNPGFLEDGDNIVVTKNKNFGKVSIDSKPYGAEIYVDGYKIQKKTPAVLDCLSDGWHSVQVSKDGYNSEKKEFSLYDSSPDIDYNLKFILNEYAGGFLAVNSQPEGCSIYLQNSYTGKKTPYIFEYIPIGTYEVMIMHNRSVTDKKEITITPYEKNGMISVNFTLEI